jgi:hypothetical protein
MIYFSEQFKDKYLQRSVARARDIQFIVARLDTQKVTCISKQDFLWTYVVPSYDLGLILHKILHDKIIIV